MEIQSRMPLICSIYTTQIFVHPSWNQQSPRLSAFLALLDFVNILHHRE